MAYSTELRLASVDMKKDPEFARYTIARILGCITAINVDYLRSDLKFPLLYFSGVRYRFDKESDPLLDAPAVLAQGFGDCDNLCCWRAAELQARFNIQAIPVFREKTLATGQTLFHIVVQYPNLVIEDPSLALGMTASDLR